METSKHSHMQRILQEVESQTSLEIQCDEKNTFCVDNEAFRFLMKQRPPNNVAHTNRLKQRYAESWQTSVEECRRLMNHIRGLKPHEVQDTLSIRNARITLQLLVTHLKDIDMDLTEDDAIQWSREQSLLKEHMCETGTVLEN